MKHIAFIIISFIICSCNTPAQNYYPDKIDDTAFYVGTVSYKDNLHNHLDYKDTVFVIRRTNDSIAILSPDILIDISDMSTMKYLGYKVFHINNDKKYVYDDSVNRKRDLTIFDFSGTGTLEIKHRNKYTSTGAYMEFQQYTFSGKRRLLR